MEEDSRWYFKPAEVASTCASLEDEKRCNRATETAEGESRQRPQRKGDREKKLSCGLSVCLCLCASAPLWLCLPDPNRHAIGRQAVDADENLHGAFSPSGQTRRQFN